jgi:hypothetical protein
MDKTQTTAEYVALANQAQGRMAWEAAAYCWERAIAVYPVKGALARLHIAKLTAKLDAARGMIAA